MLRKTLLTTSALIVAGSMALASPRGSLRPAHTLAQIQQLHRDALAKKGMVLDRKGVPIAIFRPPAAPAGNSGPHYTVQPSMLAERDSYSNFSKNKNALYLSWFGWLTQDGNFHSTVSGSFCYSYDSSRCSNYYKYKYVFSETIRQSAAQPFSGLTSASSISLGISPYNGTGKGKVAIYVNHVATASNPCATVSGPPSCPGKPIKGASGTFSAHSRSSYFPVVTVSFSPVELRKGAKYWVVVTPETGNRLTWHGEARDWTGSAPTGEDYKYIFKEIIDVTRHTTRYGRYSTYTTTINDSTKGWIHTAAFTTGEWPGAFSINSVPP